MVKHINMYSRDLILLARAELTRRVITGKAELNFYTQIKTVTQQWKDFLNNDGPSATFASQDFPEASPTLQAPDFPSDGTASPALHSRDFSNANDESLELNARDFANSDGESLPEHSTDMPNADEALPSLSGSNGLPWTLTF